MLGFRFRATLARALIGLPCAVRVAHAQTAERPAEKVRVTYDASPGCPSSDAFIAQVRARVGTDWEAPPNELARTIEVRVTGGADKNVARIDFVDENNQPITRVVTAKTCEEVVTGIALVTALAIESRIAEAVGQSEPPAPAPPKAAEAPKEEPKPTAPPAVAPPVPPPQQNEHGGPPFHVDLGAGALGSVGALPLATIGFRGLAGIGFQGGPDFRLGVDFSSSGTVETASSVPVPSGSAGHYLSSFSLLTARASACPFAFGTELRLLPCGGVDIGMLMVDVTGTTPGSSLRADDASGRKPFWLSPFLGARADAAWDVFFVELDVSFAIPVSPTKRDLAFQTKGPNGAVSDTVYTIWPVVPSASLALGVRL